MLASQAVMNLTRTLVCLLGLAVAGAAAQPPEKDPPPTPAEEESIPGLPDGKPLPLPEHVRWSLNKFVTAKTRTRERITLAGPWRFAAVPERETPVVRAEMGWIEMPEVWFRENPPILDARLRVADGQWRGRPLDKFPWAWAEREIEVTEVQKWMSRRIFLVVQGPWARAEVFLNAESITGAERNEAQWFEITESLVYPGVSLLSMRLQAADSAHQGASGPSDQLPYVGLELLPVGPRVEAIQLNRRTEAHEVQATIELARPAQFSIQSYQAVPLTLHWVLEDAADGQTVLEQKQAIGTLSKPTRSITVSLPAADTRNQSFPARARLRVRLGPASGGTYDEAFPVEFQADALPTAP
jgi:hypothetical protein